MMFIRMSHKKEGGSNFQLYIIFQEFLPLVFKGVFGLNLVHERWECCVFFFVLVRYGLMMINLVKFHRDRKHDRKNPNGSFLEGKSPLFFRETGWLVKYYSILAR